ncbi:MAG: endonuclease/exonuclease/phosphatase family protein [Chloroflexota bacterium]
MKNKLTFSVIGLFSLLLILLSACSQAFLSFQGGTPQSVDHLPVIAPTPGVFLLDNNPLIITEVMAGDLDYVEIYNASAQAVNLKGHYLVYRLGTDNLDQPIFTFEQDIILPGWTHYLLGHEGDVLPLSPDVEFTTPMNISTGGVALFDQTDTLVDSLAWGKTPVAFVEGTGLPKMPKDAAFSRLAQDDQATDFYSDMNDNLSDFSVVSPNPQNSQIASNNEQALHLHLSGPEISEPGQSFDYQLMAENNTDLPMSEVVIALPLPVGTTVESISHEGQLTDGVVTWVVTGLEANQTVQRTVTVQGPYIYTQLLATGYQVQTDALSSPLYGPPIQTDIKGGVIPIGVARQLAGERVTVQGMATMYTGGFYAGGGNVKFYLQDETGGIQIQVFDENGPVPTIAIGDNVQVSGTVGVFRDSIQISPDVLPDDVLVRAEIGQPEVESVPPAFPADIATATENIAKAGQYVAVRGQVTRADEFTYSYEVDLLDDSGEQLFVYIDKLTNLTNDTLIVGEPFEIGGILEYYQGRWELKPRLADDLKRIYDQPIRLELLAPTTITPQQPISYTVVLHNHTKQPLTEVVIIQPDPGAVIAVSDKGLVDTSEIRWQISAVPANDSSWVQFEVSASDGVDQVVQLSPRAMVDGYPEPIIGASATTFIGNTVPIWAIQGAGTKSPYMNQGLQTKGVVTAVFDHDQIPGFFIQEIDTDEDITTSAGLFVRSDAVQTSITEGDLVQVSGIVKEVTGQTELHLASLTILDQGLPLPEAIILRPPADLDQAKAYYEAVEGMVVQAQGIAVSPISKYGETNIVLNEVDPTRVLRNFETGLMVAFDDRSWTQEHTSQQTLPFTITTGDQIVDLVGPLAYTFGQYKIEPLQAPTVMPGNINLDITLPELAADSFSIAAFNAENFFDSIDPHPSSPTRPTRKQYLLKTAKVVNTIAAMGYPTIIGFSEVENIKVLERVAKHDSLAGYDYQAVLIEGRDSRGIDVGYLVRGDQAEIFETSLHLDDEGLFTRGPLVLGTNITVADKTIQLFTIVNHFVSLGAGFEATEPRRIKQAAWNIALADQLRQDNPEAHIAIIGDLNTFYDAPAIDVFRQAGYVHAFAPLAPETRYTYIYQGVSEVLDHILLSPNLATLMTGIDILHLNADAPPPDITDDSPQRASDHDPIVARFRLP